MNSNMNDQYQQMGYFRESLIQFNTQLKGSMNELATYHDHVSPHWQDDMRKTYDQQWRPLDATMKRYLNHEGPKYVEFLSIKLHALRCYLHGR